MSVLIRNPNPVTHSTGGSQSNRKTAPPPPPPHYLNYITSERVFGRNCQSPVSGCEPSTFQKCEFSVRPPTLRTQDPRQQRRPKSALPLPELSEEGT